MRGLYPGSFDPPTRGHLDIIERSAAICDELIVAVGVNSAKTPYFPADTRVAMLRSSVEHLDNVRVVLMPGTVIDTAAAYGVNAVVKGVRHGQDVVYEMAQASINCELGAVETLFLPARPEHIHVSSTMVRELLRWGMDTSRYVPPAVESMIKDNRTITA